MSKNLIALILAAGAAALAYSVLGKRVGYSNSSRVWVVTGSVFVLGYIIIITALVWVIHV